MEKLAFIIISAIISILVSGTTLSYASAHKLNIHFNGVNDYFGKVKVTLKDLDIGKTLIKKQTVDIGKLHKSQKSNCCVKILTFKDKGSFYKDNLQLRVTGNGGSWTSNTLYRSTAIDVEASLDEITCGDEC